jgi:hypothetical protein
MSGHVIKPHFHSVDQYQVVVRGVARSGKHPMCSGDFHYADAYTSYGPIVAGEGGLAFFTLRPSGVRRISRDAAIACTEEAGSEPDVRSTVDPDAR